MAREATDVEDMIEIFNMSRELGNACRRQIGESDRECEEHQKALLYLMVQDVKKLDLILKEVDDNAVDRQGQPSLPGHPLIIDRKWILNQRRKREEGIAVTKP